MLGDAIAFNKNQTFLLGLRRGGRGAEGNETPYRREMKLAGNP